MSARFLSWLSCQKGRFFRLLMVHQSKTRGAGGATFLCPLGCKPTSVAAFTVGAFGCKLPGCLFIYLFYFLLRRPRPRGLLANEAAASRRPGRTFGGSSETRLGYLRNERREGRANTPLHYSCTLEDYIDGQTGATGIDERGCSRSGLHWLS